MSAKPRPSRRGLGLPLHEREPRAHSQRSSQLERGNEEADDHEMPVSHLEHMFYTNVRSPVKAGRVGTRRSHPPPLS